MQNGSTRIYALYKTALSSPSVHNNFDIETEGKSEIPTTMRHICFSFMALSAFIIVGSSAGLKGLAAGLTSQEEKEKCVLSPGASPCPKCLGCLDRCETQLIEAVDACTGVDIECVNKFVENSANECLECTGYLCYGLHLPQCCSRSQLHFGIFWPSPCQRC